MKSPIVRKMSMHRSDAEAIGARLKAAEARADAAEKKLAALMEAHRAMCAASLEHRSAIEAEVAELEKPETETQATVLDALGERITKTAKAAHAAARAFHETALRTARGES